MVDRGRSLAHTICELMADAFDYPLFHTRKARSDRILLIHRTLTVAPSFQHLLDIYILVARRPLVGNGLEDALSPYFHSKRIELYQHFM